MTDYRLNTKQQEAVEATEGRVKVVAGAGSGKTSVLVHRYAYLINELGINPDNILCMTFTNKAAAEMKNRIAKLTNSYNVNDFVCTIHGFCVKFIRKVKKDTVSVFQRTFIFWMKRMRRLSLFKLWTNVE